jgi:hypothetical protein
MIVGVDYSAYPEWDERNGWALTLPPPCIRDAHIAPHVINGNTLRWSCHWLTDGYGGAGYFYPLPEALLSVGKFVAKRRAAHPSMDDCDGPIVEVTS